MSHSVHRSAPRKARWRWSSLLAVGAVLAAGAVPVVANAGPSSSNHYRQTNLVSDIAGVARITDPNLVNPWGLAAAPTSPLWVADNGTNVSTLYTGAIKGSIPMIVPLVVRIPEGAPTGVVFNGGNGFVVHAAEKEAPATFIFDSEAGRITAWSKTISGSQAQTEFSSPTAVYKGLALASSGGQQFLYATNFHDGRIDVFNDKFAKVTLTGDFSDPALPEGYAPFGIMAAGEQLYVTYAKQNAAKHDDVAGEGHGFVDVYTTSGKLVRRLISRGALNSPWGLAIAPAKFGEFGGDLLVGNFGDGAIHAYDPKTGALKGQLMNQDGNPILINGLWSLRFGNGTFGTHDTLVFAAGIGDESHGLLGEINATH